MIMTANARRKVSITSVDVRPLDAPMNAPFEIASGSKTSVSNVLVKLTLSNGIVGYGEGAPMTERCGESQTSTLAAVRRQGRIIKSRPISSFRSLLDDVDAGLGPKAGAARAALSMAILDAWCRNAGLPLHMFFGGAGTQVHTDVTVTLGSAEEARRSARDILSLGVKTIKIKVGRDVSEDIERVLAVSRVSPGLRLMLDANCGFDPSQSLRLLSSLKRRGVTPVLFEQPADKDDWKGLAAVYRHGKVPVAADESVCSLAEAWKMARVKAAQVVNIKIMKYGLLEAWEIALVCRAAGLGLMIGGMVESSLAMGAAAHFAAGVGGFDFVDLDTPLWFLKDPMKGLRIGRGGRYDLSKIKSGIGVVPRKFN